METNSPLPLRTHNFPVTSIQIQEQRVFKSENLEILKIYFPAEKVEQSKSFPPKTAVTQWFQLKISNKNISGLLWSHTRQKKKNSDNPMQK